MSEFFKPYEFRKLYDDAPEPHPDDIAVDSFAAAMKLKMSIQRSKGYGGWDDESQCPVERLQQMLVEHIAKGDQVDVGNFAMMLFSRNALTFMPAQAASVPDEWVRTLSDLCSFAVNAVSKMRAAADLYRL